MDPSERLEFIRGNLHLSAPDLTPEEALTALLVAIDKTRRILKHVPMRPLEEIARDWDSLALSSVTSVTYGAGRRAVNTPMLNNGLRYETRLLPLHLASAIETVDPNDYSRRKRKYLYLDNKGAVVAWSIELAFNKVEHGPSTHAYLTSPTSFSVLSRQDLDGLAQQDHMAFVAAVRGLTYAVHQAIERRLKIVEELQGAKQNLDGVSRRIGA